MLRRPPTALSISADDLAAYDLRHQARLAAHARSLAQQREQEASERAPHDPQDRVAAATVLAAPVASSVPPSRSISRQLLQQQQQQRQTQRQRQQQAADAAAARPRRPHAPGAIQTGSPGAPHDDGDDDSDGADAIGRTMGMSLDGSAPTHSFPSSTTTDPRRRRTSDGLSSSGEDDNIDDRGAGAGANIANQTERALSPPGALTGGPADTHPSRNNRAARVDAERRRLLERERILGRGNHDAGGGARRQQQGGSGVVGDRAPRR